MCIKTWSGTIDLNLNLDANIGTIFDVTINSSGSSNVPADSISQGGMGQINFILWIDTGTIKATR